SPDSDVVKCCCQMRFGGIGEADLTSCGYWICLIRRSGTGRLEVARGASERGRCAVVVASGNGENGMPGSEPRLNVNDGLTRAPAIVVPTSARPASPVPRVTNRKPSAPASPVVGTNSDGNDREYLPPLVSLGDVVTEAPPWLVSAAIHMLLVIILGLIFITP